MVECRRAMILFYVNTHAMHIISSGSGGGAFELLEGLATQNSEVVI